MTAADLVKDLESQNPVGVAADILLRFMTLLLSDENTAPDEEYMGDKYDVRWSGPGASCAAMCMNPLLFLPQQLTLTTDTVSVVLYRYLLSKYGAAFEHPAIMQHLRTRSFFSLSYVRIAPSNLQVDNASPLSHHPGPRTSWPSLCTWLPR